MTASQQMLFGKTSAPIISTSIGVASANASATISITVPGGGVPANRTIYVLVYECAASASVGSNGSVADSASNTYVEVSGGVFDATASRLQVFQVTSSNALVSSNTITYTLVHSANSAVMTAFYVSGLNTASSPYDSATKATSTFSHAQPSANQSGVPSVARELFIAACGWTNASTADAGLTLDTGNGWAGTPPTAVVLTPVTGGLACGVGGGLQVNAGVGQLTTQPTFVTTTNVLGGTIVFGASPP